MRLIDINSSVRDQEAKQVLTKITQRKLLKDRRMWRPKKVLTLGVVFLCVCILPEALAESDEDEWVGFAPEDMYDAEEFTGLTGDWNGRRRKLADDGITIDIDVIQFYQGVMDGGTDSSWKYGGTGEYNFNFDFQKLGLWPGAFVNVRAKHQFGQFVNTATGGILAANTQGMFPLPDYDGVALPQVVLTQFLSESMAVFLGKIDTTEADSTRFSGARGKDNFMNQSLVFNPVLMRGMPLSALGGGLLFIWPDARAEKPTSLAFTVLGPDGLPNRAGWDDDFEDGTLYSIEFKRSTKFFGKDGSHTFAGLYVDKDFTLLDQNPRLMLDHLLGLGATLEENDGTWAFLFNFDQYLITEPEDETQGLGLFGRLGFADDETNFNYAFYSIGLGGKGIVDGRDEDTFGIGYYYIEPHPGCAGL
jgi:porin